MSLTWINNSLNSLRHQGLLRTQAEPFLESGPYITTLHGQRLLNLASNDYLSLASERISIEGVGATASRLVTGDLYAHQTFETQLATWLNVEKCLIFSSGYAANVGTISALADKDTLIISDQKNHASIIDGCRLSRAHIVVVPHCDVNSVKQTLQNTKYSKRIVVTDSYFSMDGDWAPLVELRVLCDQYNAVLYVDEAHALGVWGPQGRGVCAELGVVPDVLIGTLGKSFGSSGAFVAGSSLLIEWLWNKARSFAYSTGIPIWSVEKSQSALPIIQLGERTKLLHQNVDFVRSIFNNHNIPILKNSKGPIIPLILNSSQQVMALANTMRNAGIFVYPMRPPTVAEGSSRIRITLQVLHNTTDLEFAIMTMIQHLK